LPALHRLVGELDEAAVSAWRGERMDQLAD
jgi:hypothetical protein